MSPEELTKIREKLITLRNKCLGTTMDARGAVILSHTIAWLHSKIKNKPYKDDQLGDLDD